MKFSIRIFLLMLIQLFLFQSCKKFDWMNPHDLNYPKSLFMPSTPSAEMQGNSVKLTWSQENENISGFILYRSSEQTGITSLTQVQKTTKEYIDASVTPGLRYTYYVLAVAGSNKSDTSKVSITPVFLPTATTGSVTDFSVDTIRIEIAGQVNNDGGDTVISRGICWSINPSPTISDSKTNEGKGEGSFTSVLTRLLFGTQYYARAYAENNRGVSYGNEVSFATVGSPILTTTAISNLTATSVIAGGNVLSDGGFPIIARGVCWSTSPNPTIANSKTVDGSGVGSFTSSITDLIPSTTYYVRAYATSQYATAYGESLNFTTKSQSTGNGASFHPYIHFNGTNSYVLVGQTDISNKINDSGGSFTMEGWVKSSVRDDQQQTIFSSGADAWGWWDYVVKLVSGRIIFAFRNGSNLTISADFPNDTLWHHFALVYENKVASLIYIDGEQKIRSNNLGMSMSSSPNVSIGVSLDGTASPYYYFKGGIRQIRVSKGAVYNANFTPALDATTHSNTIAFWDLGEGSGNTINANISSYNGTLLNGSWIKN